jgi:outer membrane protein, heavy metal efflux system
VKALLAAPLTAETAARVALLNNRGARAAAEELGIAQAELAGVKRLPNPTLSAALRFLPGGEKELDLAAMIDVSALLFALARGGAAEDAVLAAKLDAVGVLVDLSYATRRGFIEYQAAVELVELRQSIFAAFDASATAAERLREAGNVTLSSQATEQALREEARSALALAHAESVAARERLNALMGVFGSDAGWRSSARLPDLPARELSTERLEREAVLGSLDLAAAKQHYVAAARQAGIVQNAGWLPELKAGVSAERGDDWGIGPALELELPLFYQGQAEAGVARARMKQREHAYAELAVQVRSAARAARARLEAARSAVVQSRDVVLPLRQRVVQQTQLEYNGMLVGVFDLLVAKREQLAALEQYLQLRRDYWLARLTAEQLLAGRAGHAR